VHGHTLLWHQAVPDWMENYVGDSDDWIAMLESHISNVAAHFAGDVVSWDVVNEAFNDDGSYRQSFWYDNIGTEYIERAFTAARAAHPAADLYYNDYSLSGIETKLDAVLVMADDFLNRGIPIDGVGFQMHISLTWPDINRIRASFAAVADLGLKVKISELDIAVNSSGTLTVLSDQLAMQQAERYRQVVKAYIDNVPAPLRGGITVWGITDADSWIPWFYNRPDWPLLFDANFQPKQALQGFADGLTGD
jgi:endo-1,4-beta-xylanase